MIHDGVKAWLSSREGVIALAGKRLYTDAAPKNAGYPRLVWFRVDTTRTKVLKGNVKLPASRWQIDAWALTRAAAAELADAVRQAVQAWRDQPANERDTWGDVTVDAVSIEDEGDDYDSPQDASDVGAYRSRIDLLIWYRE